MSVDFKHFIMIGNQVSPNIDSNKLGEFYFNNSNNTFDKHKTVVVSDFMNGEFTYIGRIIAMSNDSAFFEKNSILINEFLEVGAGLESDKIYLEFCNSIPELLIFTKFY